MKKRSLPVVAVIVPSTEFEINGRSPRRVPLQSPVLPVMATALHVQLSKRFLQRRLDRCHVFGSMIFLHRRLGTLDSGLGRGDIYLLSLQRHVGQD
jgi:hypothetical protein